tara:strand:- start:224 stop:1261 length:1038 start_codon:yes stop_codon:yes gene_type:complete
MSDVQEQAEQPVIGQSMDDFMGEQFDALEAEEIEEQVSADVEESVETKTDNVETETVLTEDAVDESESEPETSQTITAPQSMSAKDRESFYELPPASQKWIVDRVKAQEGDYTRKSMEVAEQKRFYEKIEKAIAPRRQQLALDGMDEGTAIDQLFALSDFASSDPVNFTRYLFQQRGIPLSALDQPGGQQAADPQMLAMQQRLQNFEGHLAQQQQLQHQKTTEAVQTDVEKFSSETPFYQELQPEMVPIVTALKQSKPGLSNLEYLQMSYKMALAANEDVSAKIEIDQRAKSESQRIAKAKKAAKQARKAGGVNIKSTGALPAAAKKAKSVDDFIGALVDERMTA